MGAGRKLTDDELEWAIRDRFKAERHPEHTVDGDNPYDFDPYDEEEEDE